MDDVTCVGGGGLSLLFWVDGMNEFYFLGDNEANVNGVACVYANSILFRE